MIASLFEDASSEIQQFFWQPNAMRSIVLLLIAFVIAFFLSKLIAHYLIKTARVIASISDSSSDELKSLRLRRFETVLSVLVAAVRVLFVIVFAYLAWRIISPSSSSALAAIGTSAIIIVVAGATIGPLLRDVTAGSAMITERWYNVGDYIRVEPFMDVAGVVERVTLRSTKLRSLNGEVIWMHNQHMQAVKVTPSGVRTIEVGILCSDDKLGQELINKVIATIPVSKLTVAKKLRITSVDQWGDNLWHIIVLGQTAPGREWLIEKYFVESLIKHDKEYIKKKVLIHEPMVRFADPAAEKSFKRAVRVKE